MIGFMNIELFFAGWWRHQPGLEKTPHKMRRLKFYFIQIELLLCCTYRSIFIQIKYNAEAQSI